MKLLYGILLLQIMIRSAFGFKVLKLSTKPHFTPFYSIERISSIRLLSNSKESDESLDDKNSKDDMKKNWVRIQLGTDDDIKKADMKERIRKASGWESKQLSEEDADFLNKALGLELQDEEVKQSISNQKLKLRKTRDSTRDSAKANIMAIKEDSIDDTRIKGYLELNPHICSGCGAPFQIKSPDSPGYLSKEKFDAHRFEAARIKANQEAISILYEAGIDINSDAAEAILREARISEEVISGIQQVASKRKMNVNKTPSIKRNSNNLDDNPTRKSKQLFVDPSLVNDISHEVMGNQKVTTIDPEKLVVENRVVRLPPNDNASIETICICQRCFRLQQYGSVEQSLRPGWSNHELLTPERFEFLLGEIKKTKGVVLCLVDLFDLHGSLLPNLRQIAGDNPIVIAANKIDLLPSDISEPRLKTWIISEVKAYCNLRGPRDVDEQKKLRIQKISERDGEYVQKIDEKSGILRSENVHMISCDSGKNIRTLLGSIMSLAEENGSKIYVMGAANVGKSSFINRLLDGANIMHSKNTRTSNQRRKDIPQPTVSNIPGTTLDFLKIRLPNGITMIDTPGLINKGQLTARLTADELKKVIPKTQVNAITLRVAEGKAVLLGGLAKVELLEGKPFYFTFYISNDVKLHFTDSSKADEFVEKHIGELLFPPNNVERYRELGPFESKTFDIEGDSWKKSNTDIVIAGLGWISVTGPGIAKVKVTIPKGTKLGTRPALLPFDATFTTAKFTGGRLLKKSKRIGPNATKSYGWRA